MPYLKSSPFINDHSMLDVILNSIKSPIQDYQTHNGTTRNIDKGRINAKSDPNISKTIIKTIKW